MYEQLGTKTGVQAVQQYRSTFQVQAAPDGLVFAPPQPNNFYGDVGIPDRLRAYVTDLRLLRHIPLAYLIPDAGLLPPECIRFFNIDPTWMDRVIDGVFSAANTGTVDQMFGASLLAMIRNAIDTDLTALAQTSAPTTSWNGGQPMTGMLIRSDLVRRWPNLIVRAFSTAPDDYDDIDNLGTVGVLRAEPISKDIYIAVFGGTPAMVHIREPFTGTRFGVEEATPGSTTWTVDGHNSDGTPTHAAVPVGVKNAAKRTLNIAGLATKVGPPRMVALHLEQNPYVQEFKNSVAESTGSVPLSNFILADGTLQAVQLRYGRTMNMAALQQRQIQIDQLNPKEKL
ncbi:MAG TPA: hypothetical protein VGN16_26145 [Acidobacteriaceae bacterium]|jgi:hypothetical protein